MSRFRKGMIIVISRDRRGNPGGCKIKWGGDLIAIDNETGMGFLGRS